MVPGRGRISLQAVRVVDTDMQHTGEAPLIALEVGLAAVTVVLMGYLRPVWHFYYVCGHPTILYSRYCSLADPGQLKKTRNIPLDGIDLEQVWAAVSALRG